MDYFVYILTNQHNNVIYTGVTNDTYSELIARYLDGTEFDKQLGIINQKWDEITELCKKSVVIEDTNQHERIELENYDVIHQGIQAGSSLYVSSFITYLLLPMLTSSIDAGPNFLTESKTAAPFL